MRSVLFIIILVLFAIQACKRDPPISKKKIDYSDTTRGRVLAEINGKNEAFFVTTYVTNETFNFYPIRIAEKKFSIVKIEKTLNTQRIYKLAVDTNNAIIRRFASFYTHWTDGDVLCEVFGVIEDDSLNNYVLITKQNNNYEEVFGIFSITLIKTQDCVEGKYPNIDTLRIRKGYFHLYLK